MLVGLLESLFLSPVFQAFFGGFDDGFLSSICCYRGDWIHQVHPIGFKDQWLVVVSPIGQLSLHLFLLQYRCTFCDTFL
jgi:hypothetical protein